MENKEIMDNTIYEYLKILKFNDDEIATLLEIAPVLEETSAEDAAKNIDAIEHFGYPIDDITYLISQNPAFLTRNFNDLVEDLQKIQSVYRDIEEALKNNPHLI